VSLSYTVFEKYRVICRSRNYFLPRAFGAPVGITSLALRQDLWHQKPESLGCHARLVAWRSAVLTEHQLVTDGRTNRHRAKAHTAPAYRWVVKKIRNAQRDRIMRYVGKARLLLHGSMILIYEASSKQNGFTTIRVEHIHIQRRSSFSLIHSWNMSSRRGVLYVNGKDWRIR